MAFVCLVSLMLRFWFFFSLHYLKKPVKSKLLYLWFIMFALSACQHSFVFQLESLSVNCWWVEVLKEIHACKQEVQKCLYCSWRNFSKNRKCLPCYVQQSRMMITVINVHVLLRWAWPQQKRCDHSQGKQPDCKQTKVKQCLSKENWNSRQRPSQKKLKMKTWASIKRRKSNTLSIKKFGPQSWKLKHLTIEKWIQREFMLTIHL